MTYRPTQRFMTTREQILSPGECAELIARTESSGYSEAPITTSRGFVMAPDIRNNTRVIEDSFELAHWLWPKIRPLVPAPRRGRLEGLNERFRFYKYAPGQFFNWHRDGAFRRDEREKSHFTLLVYLNEEFVGGGTEFEEYAPVQPRTGMALLFDHILRHRGAPVLGGTKYVLRSDVMVRDVEGSGV